VFATPTVLENASLSNLAVYELDCSRPGGCVLVLTKLTSLRIKVRSWNHVCTMEELSNAQIESICRNVVQRLTAPHDGQPEPTGTKFTKKIDRLYRRLEGCDEALSLISKMKNDPVHVGNAEELEDMKKNVKALVIKIQDTVNHICRDCQ
jgi:hypothetical protein